MLRAHSADLDRDSRFRSFAASASEKRNTANLSFGRTLATALCLLTFLIGPTSTSGADPHRLVVYAPNLSYTLELGSIKGTDYIGVAEVLEPLGKIEARTDSKNWVLTFTSGQRTVEARFRDGKKEVTLPGDKLNLGGNFILNDSRGAVPVEALQELVPRITGLQ